MFAEEMGARLRTPLPGHDIDLFDDYCEHLLVREADTGEVIGTYRVLTPAQAKRVGCFYSDTEFDLTRLRARGDEDSQDAFHNSLTSTMLLIAAFAALTTVGVALIGPQVMQIAFGDKFTYDRLGLDAIAQVNLGVRTHRNRPLTELASMSRQVIATLLSRCGIPDSGAGLTQFFADGDGYTPRISRVSLEDRPPMITLRPR